jgi:hypothetical protein
MSNQSSGWSTVTADSGVRLSEVWENGYEILCIDLPSYAESHACVLYRTSARKHGF